VFAVRFSPKRIAINFIRFLKLYFMAVPTMAKMKTSSEREKWSRIEKLPAEWNAVNLRDILPMVFRFYLVHFVYTKRASAEIGATDPGLSFV